MNKRLLAKLLILLLLCLSLPGMALANPASMYVKSSGGGRVNLRSKPTTSGKNIITSIAHGSVVDVLSYTGNGSWAHVQYSHSGKLYTGYMSTRYLSVQRPEAFSHNSKGNTSSSSEPQMPNFSNFELVDPYEVIVRPSKPNGFVNFRWAPSYDCRVIMRCYANYPLTVIAQDKSWVQVSDPATGYVGFMYRKFVTPVVSEIGQGVLVQN